MVSAPILSLKDYNNSGIWRGLKKLYLVGIILVIQRKHAISSWYFYNFIL